MKVAIILIMYLAEVLVEMYSAGVFLSYFKWSPSYEGSGMQFVLNDFTASILGVLGLLYLIFHRQFHIPVINMLIPWVIIFGVLVNPVFHRLNVVRVSSGTAILVFLIVVGMVFKIKHLGEWATHKKKGVSPRILESSEISLFLPVVDSLSQRRP